jgi:hypothetical protein
VSGAPSAAQSIDRRRFSTVTIWFALRPSRKDQPTDDLVGPFAFDEREEKKTGVAAAAQTGLSTDSLDRVDS